MKHKHAIELAVIVGLLCSLIAGCAGTPKMSRWSPPTKLSYERVYNAALAAATANQFTVVTQDRASGIISLRKEMYAGDKMAERRMSVRVKQVADKIEVSTNVSGSDFGVIEGTLGGAVHKEITNNFYHYLFRELDITDPSARNVVIEDAY